MLTGNPDPGDVVGVDDGGSDADEEEIVDGGVGIVEVDKTGEVDEVESVGGVGLLDTTGVDDELG